MGQFSQLISLLTDGMTMSGKIIRDMQGMAAAAPGTGVSQTAAVETSAAASTLQLQNGGTTATVGKDNAMSDYDQDLGGDDIKMIDWWVMLMTPDAERLLDYGKTSLNYATTPGSFATKWIQKAVQEYRKHGKELTEEEIEKYVDFRYQVTDRIPKRGRDYERHRTEYQRRMADSLDVLAKTSRATT